MIFRIVIVGLFAGDYAFGAPVFQSGSSDRVLPVIAPWFQRQAFFSILENDAVPLVRKRATLFDQGEGFLCFWWEFIDGNPVALTAPECLGIAQAQKGPQ